MNPGMIPMVQAQFQAEMAELAQAFLIAGWTSLGFVVFSVFGLLALEFYEHKKGR